MRRRTTYRPYSPYIVVQRRKRYGLFSFAFDAVLTVLTGGLWLIWIFVREMRGLR